VCTPLEEYFPVRDIAEPNTMYSPSTFAKEDVKDTSANVIAEIDVIISFTNLFIISPSLIN
jgi:hypothetical protein